MINNKSLRQLYESVINGEKLTTKILNSYGFNFKDLSDLINQGILKRIKKGHYIFLGYENLLYYGKSLIAEKKYDKANKCFHKCYELNSNPNEVLLRCLNNKEYEIAFVYFEIFSKSSDLQIIADCNFYLYLLNIITTIPDKQSEYVKTLKLEDIMVKSQDKDINFYNRMRMFVFQNNLSLALKLLNDLIKNQDKLTVQNRIIKTLLTQAIEAKKLHEKKILNLVTSKQYELLKVYLENKMKYIVLSLTDKYILKLIIVILNVKNNKNVPEKKIFQTDDIYDAIDGCNYELAFELSTKYMQKDNTNESEKAIHLLLRDIGKLIHNLSIKKENNDTEINHLAESSMTFSRIVSYLLKRDLDNCFKSLREYLKLINKSEYEFFIVDLIKISLLNEDIAFTKPILALTNISRNINVDISIYIQEFYISLSEQKFDEARIYLDIISKANNLGCEQIQTTGLLQALNNAENNTIVEDTVSESNVFLHFEDTLAELDEFLETSPEITSSEEITCLTSEEIPSTTPAVVKNRKDEKDKLDEITDSERNYIAKKHKLLTNNRGIILLKPMPENRIKKILSILEEYPDVATLIIGTKQEQRIVLRYKPVTKEIVSRKELIERGKNAYKTHNYNEAIKYFMQLLEIGEPRAFVYATIGLAYYKKKQKDLAIDYLTVATHKSKLENGRYDFTDFIARLKGEQNFVKPYFKMKIDDFENDFENYYGIENFDEINTYILETGLDVESACQQLELSEEQIDIIKLLYAREYYIEGVYDKGDLFLKSFEKSQNKTKTTIKIFNNIRKNKRLYNKRMKENSQALTLTLQPAKKQ